MNTSDLLALLSPAEVLCALHDGTQPQGMGFLHAVDGPVEVAQAQAFLDAIGDTYVDYFLGRPIKCDVGERPLNTRLYERDAGVGAADVAIQDYVERQTR